MLFPKQKTFLCVSFFQKEGGARFQVFRFPFSIFHIQDKNNVLNEAFVNSFTLCIVLYTKNPSNSNYVHDKVVYLMVLMLYFFNGMLYSVGLVMEPR